jgi:hypothetical protein
MEYTLPEQDSNSQDTVNTGNDTLTKETLFLPKLV